MADEETKELTATISDFSGGWNTSNAWLLSPREMAICEDFSLIKGQTTRRPLFVNVDSSGIQLGQITGLHYVPNNKHIIATIGNYNGSSWDIKKTYNFSILNPNSTNPDIDDVNSYELPNFEHCWLPSYATKYKDQIYLTNGVEIQDLDVDGEPLSTAPFNNGFIGKYMVEFAGRLWCANTQWGDNHIFCTAIDKYPDLADNWRGELGDIDETINEMYLGDEKPITALVKFLGNLYAFKNDCIYAIHDDISGFKVVDNIGCIDQKTIAVAYNSIIFLAKDGVYMWAGSQELPRKVSGKIDEYLNNVYCEQPTKTNKTTWKNISLQNEWGRSNYSGTTSFISWDDTEKGFVITNPFDVNPSGYLYLTTGIAYETLFDDYKKGGNILLRFSTDDETYNTTHLGYRLRIAYQWTDSSVYSTWTHADKTKDLYYHDVPMGCLMDVSDSASAGKYLHIRIYYTLASNKEATIYGVVLIGSEVDTNASDIPLHCALPNACFYNNQYLLSVASDIEHEPYCNKVLAFTITTAETQTYAWSKWNYRYITDSIFYDNQWVFGTGKDLGITNGGDFIETIPLSDLTTQSIGGHQSGKCLQKIKTASLDFGMPENNKYFNYSVISYVDKSRGRLKISWYSDYAKGSDPSMGFTYIDTEGTTKAKTTIIEHISPYFDDSKGYDEHPANYGRRIQYQIEGITLENSNDYAEFDLIGIKCYFRPERMILTVGEE